DVGRDIVGELQDQPGKATSGRERRLALDRLGPDRVALRRGGRAGDEQQRQQAERTQPAATTPREGAEERALFRGSRSPQSRMASHVPSLPPPLPLLTAFLSPL